MFYVERRLTCGVLDAQLQVYPSPPLPPHTNVDLLRNPEAYTGYVAPHAHRIWGAVYEQPAFSHSDAKPCAEKRVLYRLVSGIHASITAHIAARYLVDEAARTYGPNVAIFRERLAAHPERVQNLYFAYLFVLRAVGRAADFLKARGEYVGGGANSGPLSFLSRGSFGSGRALVVSCRLAAARLASPRFVLYL